MTKCSCIRRQIRGNDYRYKKEVLEQIGKLGEKFIVQAQRLVSKNYGKEIKNIVTLLSSGLHLKDQTLYRVLIGVLLYTVSINCLSKWIVEEAKREH